jgi:hypothetical protein
MTVAYGTVVGAWAKACRYVLPMVGDTRQPRVLDGAGPTAPMVALSGQSALCPAYNVILNAFKGKDYDAVVLLHDDLQITDPLFEHKAIAALMGEDVALVGVAGGKSDQSLHWWNGEKVGHQMTDSGLLDFGLRTGDVAFIEGSVMVFSPWAVENLRFDERYPGWAGYDDICLTARAAGKRVVVADIDTHHHTTVGWRSPERKADFDLAEEIFRAKWGIA